MPLYEFQCTQCQREFEELVFHTDEVVQCPECQSQDVKRTISLPGIPAMKAENVPTFTGSCSAQGPPCGPRCARFADG